MVTRACALLSAVGAAGSFHSYMLNGGAQEAANALFCSLCVVILSAMIAGGNK